ATECAAPGHLMFQLLRYSRYQKREIQLGSRQLNVLHQATSCSSCYDIRDIKNGRFSWVPAYSLDANTFYCAFSRFVARAGSPVKISRETKAHLRDAGAGYLDAAGLRNACVLVSNLLGFSLLYRSHKCLRMLLDHGSDPFQATYFIEYTSQGEQQRKILLYEAPAFLLLTGSIQPRHRAVCIALLVELRVSDAEFHIPITLRRQQMEPPQEPVSATIRFADAWECLDKEIEKKGGDDLAQNKVLLRELKAVYRANKFDRLDQPNVEK
ncbi:hypothetical protein CLF_112923, partial [Clonorchis sinensis]